MATATLLKASVVIAGELESVESATIANTAAAATHMSAGFFLGGAACFDSAISCAGFLSVLVAGTPVSWIDDSVRISCEPHRGHLCVTSRGPDARDDMW
jgi:hypothetical protein